MKVIRDAEALIRVLTDRVAAISPQAQSVLEAVLVDAEKAGVIEDVVLDAVGDAHAIIEGMKDAPDWLHALAKAGQADADKVLAVLGHYGTLGVKLNALLADLREGRLKMVTETRIVKG